MVPILAELPPSSAAVWLSKITGEEIPTLYNKCATVPKNLAVCCLQAIATQGIVRRLNNPKIWD